MLPHGYPVAAYRQVSIETAPPSQIIVMLYRRGVLAARVGADAIEAKDMEKAHFNLIRAQAIVFELQAALNHDAGEIAEGLYSIYEYFKRELTEANLKKDPDPARRVADLMGSLLQAWETILGNGAQVSVGTDSEVTIAV